MDAERLQQMVSEVAKRDLREDETTRQQFIDQINTWMETNPDIKDYKRDDFMILLFLRKGKFSIPKTQEVFLKLMNFMDAFRQFMRNSDVLDSKVNHFSRNGYVYVSPFIDDNGYHTVLLEYAKFDPSHCDYTDHIKAQVTTAKTLMTIEVAQVMGIVFVIDMTGITAEKATHMPLPVVLAYMKAIQQCIPLRFKAFHVINLPSALKWLLDLIISHATEKMRSRYKIHSSLQDLHKHVNPRVLPKEYGGTMPSKDMIDLWYKKLLPARESVLRWERVELVHPVNADLKTSIAQLPGSFRKLEVD